MVDAPRLALPAVAGAAGVAAVPEVAVAAGWVVEVLEFWPVVPPRLKEGAAVAVVEACEVPEL